jgi:hypothetical protein
MPEIEFASERLSSAVDAKKFSFLAFLIIRLLNASGILIKQAYGI